MKRVWGKVLLVAGVGMVLPFWSWAQDVPITGTSTAISDFHTTLETVRHTMMANVSELVTIAQSMGAIGSLLYVCSRVWGHMARAEPIDFYPLLRPFALAILLANYSGFISVVDGIMEPTVSGTKALVTNANAAIAKLLAQKKAALEQSQEWQMYVGPNGSGSEEKWEEYSGEASTGAFSGLTNAVEFRIAQLYYNFKNSVKVWLSQVLEIVYEAAALCIDALRTFELVLFAILGPLAIGLSTFDGFKQCFTAWLGRYVNVFLWLPVANIFGSLCAQIQIAMLQADLNQIKTSGSTSFGETDAAYLIFLIIAIVGYFCVPSITSHIINVFPSGGGAMLSKVTGSGQAAAMAPVEAGKGALGAAAGMM